MQVKVFLRYDNQVHFHTQPAGSHRIQLARQHRLRLIKNEGQVQIAFCAVVPACAGAKRNQLQRRSYRDNAA